jgi:hypothetical protein
MKVIISCLLCHQCNTFISIGYDSHSQPTAFTHQSVNHWPACPALYTTMFGAVGKCVFFRGSESFFSELMLIYCPGRKDLGS